MLMSRAAGKKKDPFGSISLVIQKLDEWRGV